MARRMTFLLLVAAIVLAMAGCAPALQDTEMTVRVYGEALPLIDRAIGDLVKTERIDRNQVTVQKVEPVDFPDASLGAPEPGQQYAEVVTPGWVIELVVGDALYRYHGSGDQVVLAPEEPVEAQMPTAEPEEVVPTAEPEVPLLATVSVEVVEAVVDRLSFTGATDLPDGACLLTQLDADGEPVAWWPSEQCVEVTDGRWELAIQLGEVGAPDELDPGVAYSLAVWQEEDPAAEALASFDVTAPEEPEKWVAYASPLFSVIVEHPAYWNAIEGYDERIGAEDGFLQLNALHGQEWDPEKACASEAYHKLEPYGSSPRVEWLEGLAGRGCLIWPSDDQPADMDGQAAAVVPYPQPVDIGGATYSYLVLYADQEHIGQIAFTLRFALPEGVTVEAPALVWEGEALAGPCQTLHLWPNGLAALGVCGEALEPVPYLGYRQYLSYWTDIFTRFGDVEADTPAGKVELHGFGQEPATPSWERALAAWARLVAMELEAGRSGASWGTALSGHWPDSEEPGTCRYLQVEEYGVAYASLALCDGGDPEDLGRGWLETSELQELDRWYYECEGTYLEDVELFGRGEQSCDEEAEDLVAWANRLFDRLASGPEVSATAGQQSWSEASPDERWEATISIEGPYVVGDEEWYHTTMKVVEVDGELAWTLLDETYHYGLGYEVPAVFRWSADGQYLYYTKLPTADGCVVFLNGSDLERLELDTGEGTTILEPGSGVWWLSLSPDETTLAYVRRQGQTVSLVLRDLATSEERQVAFDEQYTQAGNVLWSPDGDSLVLTLAANPCDLENWTHAIVLVDTIELAASTLVPDDSRRFASVEWPEPASVLLQDDKGGVWSVEVETGDLSQESSVEVSAFPVPESLPPGIVYRTESGLWHAAANDPAELLLRRPLAAISPSGQRAAYAAEDEIVVVDLATRAEAILPGPPGYDVLGLPQWSTDDLLVYGSIPASGESGPSYGHLTAVSPDGSWAQVLDPEKVSYALPATAPDGQAIAYDRQGEGWLFSWMGTSEAVDLDEFGLVDTEPDRAASPAWSPDGTKLAWVVGGGFATDGDWRLAVLVLDLTEETSVLLHPYEPIGVGGWPSAPVWSPDGEWLAYEVWPAAAEEDGGIWVLRADGSEELRLGPGSGPVWSPDGQRLAYTERLADEETTVWFVETSDWEPGPLNLAAGAVVVAWW